MNIVEGPEHPSPFAKFHPVLQTFGKISFSTKIFLYSTHFRDRNTLYKILQTAAQLYIHTFINIIDPSIFSSRTKEKFAEKSKVKSELWLSLKGGRTRWEVEVEVEVEKGLQFRKNIGLDDDGVGIYLYI